MTETAQWHKFVPRGDGVSNCKVCHGDASEHEQLPCGHDATLAVMSAETGLFLFCDLCNCREERRDALQMESHYKAKVEALEQENAALKGTVPENQAPENLYRPVLCRGRDP